ncbi:putative Cobyrinic acid a [Paratrimastix pyriformis]|uniref:Queuosine 5'-phosphate N-glycosylase/hydrolase n=1 Tax=Paratrimastix pyriformis TaxID=342808 RepID=A0ABQ8UF12_9EUKA|nr:putative Cobyrinic acid a [Paratrimastix pyriformis]
MSLAAQAHGCAASIIENAKSVSIDRDILGSFFAEIGYSVLRKAAMVRRLPLAFENKRMEINWIVTNALLQFGQEFQPSLLEHSGHTSIDAINYALVSSHIQGFSWTARAMSELELDEVASMFQLPLTTYTKSELAPGITQETPSRSPLAPYIEELHRVIRESGQALLRAGYADFAEVVLRHARPGRSDPPSAWSVVAALAEACPAFDDRATYVQPASPSPSPSGAVATATAATSAEADLCTPDSPAPSTHTPVQCLFHRKAQLGVAELYRRFRQEDPSLFEFADIGTLAAPAEPNTIAVLRGAGVIQVRTDTLREAIEGGHAIEAGSPEEIELRAACVVAVDRLADMCREHPLPPPEVPVPETAVSTPGPAPTPIELYWYLGLLSKTPRYQSIPRHLARNSLAY